MRFLHKCELLRSGNRNILITQFYYSHFSVPQHPTFGKEKGEKSVLLGVVGRKQDSKDNGSLNKKQ